MTRARGAPAVTVLTPTWRDVSRLPHILSDLSRQSFDDFEVIVIDASPGHQALDLDLPGLLGKVEVICSPVASTPHQLNLGLAQARGRFVARIDTHTRVPADYLATITGRLEEGYAGVGLRKTAVGSSHVSRAFARVLNSSNRTGGSVYHAATDLVVTDHVPYAAYPTELVRSLGGWDERFPTNQDVELDARVVAAGGVLVVDGSCESLWLLQDGAGSILRQYWRYGTGRGRTARLHPRTFRIRHLALIGATGAAALALGGAATNRLFLAVPFLLLVGVNSVLAVTDVRRDANRSPDRYGAARDTGLQAVIATATQVAWGAGFLRTALDPRALKSRAVQDPVSP